MHSSTNLSRSTYGFDVVWLLSKSGALASCARQIEELVALDPIRAATQRDVYTALSQVRRER